MDSCSSFKNANDISMELSLTPLKELNYMKEYQ